MKPPFWMTKGAFNDKAGGEEKIQAICIINSNRTGVTSTCFELPS